MFISNNTVEDEFITKNDAVEDSAVPRLDWERPWRLTDLSKLLVAADLSEMSARAAVGETDMGLVNSFGSGA